MIVTLDELKRDLDRYVELVGEEEIVITKDGRSVAKLSRVTNNKGAIIRSLRGILPADVTREEAREARLAKYENSL
ncbi:MAG: type II toxin-antitoxin system Phd/YefM family antitoxin [Deltaproteobacteria bacterium]|jgi:antitoxin (DNA-binding transcriptional repressor) of toxin-antitoxin stability system|nr:type II toxin-antitoxin system Phd/YefM family antitoxin [Deltaproteobacteria bacterium]